MSQAIVIIGQTGSGKTTLAKSVSRKLGLAHIESGAVAREIANADRHTKAELALGHMAPEFAMRAAIVDHIKWAKKEDKDFVIEGFPRTLEQLYILESMRAGTPVGVLPMYFVLDCDPLLCIRRLVERHRDHDHPDAVGTRFRSYVENTEPMIQVIWNHCRILDGALSTEDLVECVVMDYETQKRENAAVDAH